MNSNRILCWTITDNSRSHETRVEIDSLVYKNDKYQLLLTNPRDALHHGKRAANQGERSVW